MNNHFLVLSTDKALLPLASSREQAKQFQAQDEDGEELEISDEELSDTEVSDGGDEVSPAKRQPSFENVHFYTTCLMDLLPSMEEAYMNLTAFRDSQHLHPGKVDLNTSRKARDKSLLASLSESENPQPRAINLIRSGIQYTPDQWAEKRDLITRLYATEGKSLRDVKEYLRVHYEFRPT